MAGTEIFGKEEIMAAADVIERRMIHRYGSHAERAGVYRAEELEGAAREITAAGYSVRAERSGGRCRCRRRARIDEAGEVEYLD